MKELKQQSSSGTILFNLQGSASSNNDEPIYLWDPALTFEIESLSMSLYIIFLLRFNNVPPDTLTGMRTNRAISVIGTKIFSLWKNRIVYCENPSIPNKKRQNNHMFYMNNMKNLILNNAAKNA